MMGNNLNFFLNVGAGGKEKADGVFSGGRKQEQNGVAREEERQLGDVH